MKRNFVIVILAAAVLVIAILLWRDNSSKQVLPDGTTLVLCFVGASLGPEKLKSGPHALIRGRDEADALAA